MRVIQNFIGQIGSSESGYIKVSSQSVFSTLERISSKVFNYNLTGYQEIALYRMVTYLNLELNSSDTDIIDAFMQASVSGKLSNASDLLNFLGSYYFAGSIYVDQFEGYVEDFYNVTA